jgi:hypothetical protein
MASVIGDPDFVSKGHRLLEAAELIRVPRWWEGPPAQPSLRWEDYSPRDVVKHTLVVREPTFSNIQATSTILFRSETPFFLCVAPKAGRTSWAYFAYYINSGTLISKKMVDSEPGYYARLKLLKNYTVSEPSSPLVQIFNKHERVLIARNPYVRFVSSYLDWLFRNGVQPEDVPIASFLDMYKERKFEKAGYKHTPYNHIDPITRSCNLQTVGFTFIFRLEQQSLWFDWMLERYGLTEKMKEWRAHGHVVYVPGVDNSSRVWDHLGSALGSRSWDGEQHDDKHNRNSQERFMKFYTPDLAREISILFESDFVHLGYPLWDGDPARFRFA